MAGNAEQAGNGLKTKKPQRLRDARASGNEISFEEEIVMSNINVNGTENNVSSIVPILRGAISGREEGLVDARTLHAFLESRRQFSDWLTMKIVKFGFEEGSDYVIASQKNEAKRGGSNRIDYHLTLDMAKELSMVENNDKGRQARRYFIECEKRLHQVAPSEAATIMSQTIGTDGFHMLGAVIKGKVTNLPLAIQRRATAKLWSQTHAAFGVRSAADIPADQLDSARNFIAAYEVKEGEYIRGPGKKEGIHLDRVETQHLYLLMSCFSAMHKYKRDMLHAARALDSRPLMAFFDQLQGGHSAFFNLDKRREEIYAQYTSFGMHGGYAMGSAA
jgi:phage anti-repressor protein